MKINLINNLLYFHIPKTAGTSIAKALKLENTSHITATEVRELIGRKKFQKMCKIGVVRNPLNRFISLYQYARMEESYYHSAKNPDCALYGKHLDYDLLRDASLEECAHFLLQGKLKHDKHWNHWKPQVFWISNKQGEIILDYMLRFEKLEKDFDVLKNELDFDAELPFLNKSGRVDRHELIVTEKTKHIVYDYYKIDYQLLPYNTPEDL